MKNTLVNRITLFVFLLVLLSAFTGKDKQKMAYKDASLSVNERVKDLLGRMTVAEKARQLDMYSGGDMITNGSLDAKKAKASIGNLGVGSIHDFYPGETKTANEVQKFVIKSSRLGIPAIIIEEGLHGYQGDKGTAFPVGIGAGSTWNPELIEKMGRVVGTEARSKGVHMLLAPVLGITREPRWGRSEETYSEDSYLASHMGLSYVIGMQGDKLSDHDAVVAEPKHFAIHSAPAGGRNQSPVFVGEREARSAFLPAFEKAVKEGKAQGIMAAYHDLDGVPCASSKWLLTDVLRGEWGFDGFVLSDLGAIRRLYNTQNTAASEKEAIIQSLEAGMDMQFYDFSHDVFQQSVIEAVENGEMDMKVLDRAVSNVLRVKFKLGLFDNPYIDEKLSDKVYHSKENQELAKQIGTESIILLKNDNKVLPLSKDKIKSVAVLGDLSNKELIGGYSPKNVEVISVLDGIKRKVGKDVVVKHSLGISLNQLFASITPENLLMPDKKSQGIHAEYFNNLELKGKPDVTKVDKDFIFYWHNLSPEPGINDYFSMRLTTYVKPDVDGKYNILVDSGDKIRYYFDGKLMYDNFEDNSIPKKAITLDLKAGQLYPLVVEYSKQNEFAGLHVKWSLESKKKNTENTLLQNAVHMAKNSDAAIIVLGEEDNEVGEGKDKMDLDLSAAELELLQAVQKTGTPVILVLLNGRPLSINWAAENVSSILEAWYPGEFGGDAVADVIFGDYNPSGHLPVTFPKSVGQLPMYYNQKPSSRHKYVDCDVKPLFPFGHGLSYTSFEYTNLNLSKESIKADESITVSVDVTNTGDRFGTDVVQLYVNDVVSSVVTPVIELKGFNKVKLAPNEKQTIQFTLGKDELALWNKEMKQVVEPGEFSIMIGKSCENIVLREKLIVIE